MDAVSIDVTSASPRHLNTHDVGCCGGVFGPLGTVVPLPCGVGAFGDEGAVGVDFGSCTPGRASEANGIRNGVVGIGLGAVDLGGRAV